MNPSLIDLARRVECQLLLGTVYAVNHQDGLMRVAAGDLLTDWLPIPADIGRHYVRWRPVRDNTQVLIACPGGDPAQAVVVQMLYSDAVPSPSDDENIDLIQFDDGSYVEHNAAAHTLKIHATAELTLSSGSQITLQAPAHRIIGPVTQTGGDMTSDGISAQHHKHSGVIKGGDQTEEPVGSSS